MLWLGHIGITIGVVHKIQPRLSQRTRKATDYRLVAALAVAPDIIDKPLGLLYPDFFGNHTRLFMHSFLFSLGVLLGSLIWTKLRQKPRSLIWIYWLAFLGHMVLDRIWLHSIHYFCWPFLGLPPALEKDAFTRWGESILSPYNVFGELVGLAILIALALGRRRQKESPSSTSPHA